MHKIILFLSLLITTNLSKAGNLCGIWFGHGYQCENINNGVVTFYMVPCEIISITQNGNYVVATKVVGDNCVTSGNVTWEGHDTATIFGVTGILGAPNNPNSVQFLTTITIIDSNHLALGAGTPYYVRATCEQIDSMSDLFTNSNANCLTCSLLNMPNIFTPNHDGINDIFKPVVVKNLTNYQLKIYSRWGNIVFSSNDSTKGWDGKFNFQPSPAGIYYWICTYSNTSNEQLQKKGFLQLIR